MPSLSALHDNFNTGILGPEWGNSYGGTTVVDGRARVPCTTGFAGCQTGYAWTLAGASFFVQVPTTPDPTGATEQAYCAVTLQGTVEGTRVGFIINKVSGTLRCVSEVGYWDEAAVEITYDPVQHLFLRLGEDGTNLTWSTSPDGTTWTPQRTLATPAWISTDIDLCALDMSAHRDAGADDYAEFDFFNTLSDSAVHAGTGTGSAQSEASATGKRMTFGGAVGTAESTATASGTATYYGTGTGSAQSNAMAVGAGSEIPEVAGLAAGIFDLLIEQGATYVQNFTVMDVPDFTWDGWTARSQIRSAPASGNGDLLLDLGDYLTIIGDTIRLAIPAAVTETLTRNGLWDLEMVNGGTVVRLLQGRAIVSLEVTR